MDTKSNVQNLWGYTHEISGGTMKSKKIGMQALKNCDRKQSGDLHSQSVWTEVFTGGRECCTSYDGDYKVEKLSNYR